MARSITVIPARRNLAVGREAQQIQLKLRVAAYCRVSTAHEEQLSSYENQVRYYTDYINGNSEYEFAGIYADEAISGTNTKKREDFNRMIADCRAGKIDLIITKSISRFARNTLDCLNYVRELKELGVGVIFEKENINTLDAKGEVLLTILSSLAQDESRSISENSTWGIRRRFEKGQHKMSTKRFLGYDTDENGKLVVNQKQAAIVKRLYDEFLSGKTVDYIKRIFEREGVVNWDGSTKWQATTLQSMLENEKYKGDAILQKSYTVDFLSKKRALNQGEMKKFYIEDDHEAIIEPWIWECVQLERQRRKKYITEHYIKSYSHRTEENPLSAKVICGCCNRTYTRKAWVGRYGKRRAVWQCSERYRIKGIVGCENRHIDEEDLEKAFILGWNSLLENQEYHTKRWLKEIKGDSDDLLHCYYIRNFLEAIADAKPIDRMETDFMLKVLDHIKIFDNGILEVLFMEGTIVKIKGKEA